MKIIEELQKAPKGAIISDKRTLALFKRLGLICDYSPFGYLESQWVYYMDENYPDQQYPERIMTYFGRLINDGDKGSIGDPYQSRKEIPRTYFRDFRYKNMTFHTTYLDGCFNAYLQKVSGSENGEVKPRMSLYGKII